jgi:hypothetical protein
MKWFRDLLTRWLPRDEPKLSTQAVNDAWANAAQQPNLIPEAPGIKQEQFADTHELARKRAERQSMLYSQIVATNNRNITRDYGGGLPPVSFKPSLRDAKIPSLTATDMADPILAEQGVNFVDQGRKPAIVPKPSLEKEAEIIDMYEVDQSVKERAAQLVKNLPRDPETPAPRWASFTRISE